MADARERERLLANREEMLKRAGIKDTQRTPEIPPDSERLCSYCGSPGPCTPLHLSCSACGRDLHGSPRSSRSNSFNSNYY